MNQPVSKDFINAVNLDLALKEDHHRQVGGSPLNPIIQSVVRSFISGPLAAVGPDGSIAAGEQKIKHSLGRGRTVEATMKRNGGDIDVVLHFKNDHRSRGFTLRGLLAADSLDGAQLAKAEEKVGLSARWWGKPRTRTIKSTFKGVAEKTVMFHFLTYRDPDKDRLAATLKDVDKAKDRIEEVGKAVKKFFDWVSGDSKAETKTD